MCVCADEVITIFFFFCVVVFEIDIPFENNVLPDFRLLVKSVIPVVTKI